jgi:hypothetical protein
VGVDAEPVSALVHGDGHVQLQVAPEPGHLLLRDDAREEILDPDPGQRLLLQAQERARDVEDGRAAGAEVEVGRVARDHLAEKRLEHAGTPIRRRGCASGRGLRSSGGTP